MLTKHKIKKMLYFAFILGTETSEEKAFEGLYKQFDELVLGDMVEK